MTIDEVIKTCKDITNYEEPCPGYCMRRTCDKCVQECEQIAEWLEELKDYRDKNKMVVRVDVENMDSIKDKIEELSKYAESQYNKAIDDFASKLIMHFADWKLSNAPFNDDETDRIREIICETIENAIGGVEEIAEQLKAGGENEQRI